jgi:hypothetical protein
VDYEKGNLSHVEILESKHQNEVTNISVYLDEINHVDKMDLHKQTGEMLNKDIMMNSIGMKKLQIVNEKM